MVGASQQTGSISGVITDTTSRELPGATLITTSDDGAVRRTTTDLNGRYHFAGLPPGRYRIEVSMPGFEAKGNGPDRCFRARRDMERRAPGWPAAWRRFD